MLCDELPEGEHRRDEAFEHLRRGNPALYADLSAAALAFVLGEGQVCADDVRPVVAIPPDTSPKIVGSVFNNLAAGGLLRSIGYHKSRRKLAHARPVNVWAVGDAHAAAAKLADLRRLAELRGKPTNN